MTNAKQVLLIGSADATVKISPFQVAHTLFCLELLRQCTVNAYGAAVCAICPWFSRGANAGGM
ncbi:hypothetical protein [Comamonas antarctica]|uniref:hypothetical protein n=1 Tax=Comamonas antarctica TaxID=2743470 RepID=UPI0028E23BA0|nr:hypothetical protein [Comamonas antarctica]